MNNIPTSCNGILPVVDNKPVFYTGLANVAMRVTLQLSEVFCSAEITTAQHWRVHSCVF